MSKTIREWLKTLPEPYRRQALINATVKPVRNIDGGEYHSLYLALNYAFRWRDTKEGHEYWQEFHSKLERG